MGTEFDGWVEYKKDHWIFWQDRQPIVAFALETPAKHAARYDWDRKNYVVGMWGSWIKTADGQERLNWPPETAIDHMKNEVESKDIRILQQEKPNA